MTSWSFLWLTVLGATVAVTRGYKLEFMSTPESLTHPLTEKLKVRCSLSDQRDTMEQVPGFQQDGEESAKNMTRIMSIIVTRGKYNIHVASVTQFDPPQALEDKDLLQVSGNVSGLTDQGAFIELTWNFPGPSQSDYYTCEINAVDDFVQSVVLSKTLHVGYTNPTVDQITHYVQVERRNIKELHEKYVAQSKMLTKVIKDYGALSKSFTALENSMDSAAVKLKTLEDEHTESGILRCGNAKDFVNRKGRWSAYITANFSQAYDKVPKVIASLHYYEADRGGSGRIGVGVQASKATKTNFTVECFTYRPSGLHNVWFNWWSTN